MIQTEIVKVNVLELASELAERELIDKYQSNMQIYVSDTDGITHFTDDTQDIFNDLYDKYFEMILNLSVE